MRVEVATPADRERFNAAIASSSYADALQSWEWGEVKRASGWKPLRLLAYDDDGTIVGAASVLLGRPAVAGRSVPIPPIAYCPRGPLLSTAEAGRALANAVRRHARQAFALVCDPPFTPGSDGARIMAEAGFRTVSAGGFGGVQPKAVMDLDITRDEDEIFAGFKSKWRYNVRLAGRKGVTVREGAREDLKAFYDILTETAERDEFLVRGRAYYETIWDHLEPAGMLKLFMADFEGAPIAGILLLGMGPRVVYVYGASSNAHRNVMPNHLIQWEAIRWAKGAGYQVYDFRGVSPVRDGRPAEEHLAGLNRFKEGFGAQYVEYVGQMDMPLRRGWYALWRTAAPRAIALLKRLRRRPAAGE